MKPRIKPLPGAVALAALAALSLPAHAALRQFEMTIEEGDLEVAPGFTAKVWAFNGQVPGPLIHAAEGAKYILKLCQPNTSLGW